MVACKWLNLLSCDVASNSITIEYGYNNVYNFYIVSLVVKICILMSWNNKNVAKKIHPEHYKPFNVEVSTSTLFKNLFNQSKHIYSNHYCCTIGVILKLFALHVRCLRQSGFKCVFLLLNRLHAITLYIPETHNFNVYSSKQKVSMYESPVNV